MAAVRSHLQTNPLVTDRELFEGYVRSVVLAKGRLKIEVYTHAAGSDDGMVVSGFDPHPDGISYRTDDALEPAEQHPEDRPVHRLSIPWTPRDVHRAKGVRDDGRPGLSKAARDQLLRAIAKARRWMHEVALDTTTFDAIAKNLTQKPTYARVA